MTVNVAGVQSASALSQGVTIYQSEFSTEINTILSEIVKFEDRKPGSEDEKKTADYIANYLKTNTSLVAKNNAYVENGVQSFTFESDFSELYETSQNIIYQYTKSAENAKKVIIACNYDAIAYKYSEDDHAYNLVNTQGVNTSACSVATLLALAKHLPYSQIGFNIEFVFFGAGESSNAGAKVYAQGISTEENDDILCMINLDNIALGKNLYYYVDEVETMFAEYVDELSEDNKLNVEEIELTHLGKVTLSIPNDLGLSYTHIAMESEAKVFKKSGLTAINIFAGDYEDGVVIGRSEFADLDVITYTENDNISYITEKVGFDKITQNLYDVFKLIGTMFVDSEFQSVLTKSQNSTNWFYAIFANENLVVYLTAIAFIAFIGIAMFVYYKLSIKAYHANVEVEFLSSVVKISEQIDKNGIDSNVPKVVSQVIAHDIKKDKVIKSKKRKKND